MILVAGAASEDPVRLALQAADDLGVEVVLVDPRRPDDYDLGLDHTSGGLSATLWRAGGHQPLDLDGVSGAYLRVLEPGPTERGRALADLLEAWSDVTPRLVANRAGPMVTNRSKPFQAQLIARCGFSVPPTLVTNEPDEVHRFAAEHGRLVYKSTSGERSVVAELAGARLEELDRVRSLPTQFQALIEGVDVRAHVVGPHVIACEARSGAVDYRYADRAGMDVRLDPVDLPPDVAGRCVALARALGLAFAGVDLRRSPGGGWVCFEVNPAPAYSWYEEATGQPIAATLVRYLAGV